MTKPTGKLLFAYSTITALNERIAELEKTCKSRSDTIIEYSNKIAELEKERDKYKAYFDSGLEKYIINYKSYPRTKKPNKGM